MTAQPMEGPQSAAAREGTVRHLRSVDGPQGRHAVPPAGTDPIAAGGNVSRDGRRGKDPRSKDPQRRFKRFLIPMINATGRMALREDPGVGLAGLLQLQRLVNTWVARVGTFHTEAIGPTQCAGDVDLELGTEGRAQVGRKWVDKNWGPSSPAVRDGRLAEAHAIIAAMDAQDAAAAALAAAEAGETDAAMEAALAAKKAADAALRAAVKGAQS